MGETHRGNYILKELCIEDRIPGLLIRRGTKKRPAVVYVHGAFLWKEYDLGLLLRLVDRGLTVLSIDAVRHGKRDPFAARGYMQLFNEAVGDFAKLETAVFVETARDIPLVVDYLNSEEGIMDVGVAGYSMGGFVALVAATLDKRIRAVVSFGAGGDWRYLFEKSSFPRLMGFKMGAGRVEGETAKLVSSWDPLERVDKMAPCAVLLLNGKVDNVVPRECAERLYEALKPYYRVFPDRLCLVEYPCGHEVTPSMERRAARWLVRMCGVRFPAECCLWGR
jgi:dienelactone hydrolase